MLNIGFQPENGYSKSPVFDNLNERFGDERTSSLGECPVSALTRPLSYTRQE